MWTVPRPTITARETFDICIEGIIDPARKGRLEGIRQQIENAEAEFDARGTTAEFYLIPASVEVAGIAGDVSANEMGQLYDRHMARRKSRGHEVYSKIMMAADHGQCPFCGHLPVSTLDHSMPKVQHPALAVTPINLIPCCKDCNHNKGTAGPGTPETQLIHAYYDNLTAARWLYAQIIQGTPPGATFYVDCPEEWDATTSARVHGHFRKLKLASLYASQAGRQLQNIRKSISTIHAAGGADAVRTDLQLRSDSWAEVSVNSWEGALYEAASEDEWYCGGGFGANL